MGQSLDDAGELDHALFRRHLLGDDASRHFLPGCDTAAGHQQRPGYRAPWKYTKKIKIRHLRPNLLKFSY
ncbi:hypothetical protein [Mesorhizobium sp. CN2-181]|uniref:hypothetical protein n=1 Tax=Mesorhizobium yinganensis TaxID=3157707 RepID=UPI0032B83F2D